MEEMLDTSCVTSGVPMLGNHVNTLKPYTETSDANTIEEDQVEEVHQEHGEQSCLLEPLR